MKLGVNKVTHEEFLMERHSLAVARIREIPGELRDRTEITGPVKRYFLDLAEWIKKVEDLREWMGVHDVKDRTIGEWKKLYDDFYDPIREGYGESWANPETAVRIFGEAYGRILSFMAAEIYRCLPLMMMGHLEGIVVLWELFLEIYTAFVYDAQDALFPDAQELRKMIYWSVSDYSDAMVSWRIREQMVPDFSRVKSIIMTADLSDLRYLYRFGDYISDSELKTAEYMNELPEEKIDVIADTFVSGYFRGFEVGRISLENKKCVTVRGSIGFERVFRRAVEKFRERGFEAVFFPAATTAINRRQAAVGYQGKSVNPQFEFDHCKDKALYYDKNFAGRHLDALKKAYEACREWVAVNGGPACFETFGEAPFTPEVGESCWHLTKKQQKLEAEYANHQMNLLENYRKSSEISFTIIAFPIPEIGPDYRAVFDEILKVNTLDNDTYRRIQQRMIDVLDRGEYVYVRGKQPNKTVMKVRLHPLAAPERETIFENCCADVNIPAGEVFTSPKLSGTEGLLHATGVYLNGIYFKDLKLRFADGRITDYSCANTGDPAADRKLVKDYLLAGYQALPLGEFAIGTNTTAYAAAEKYKIADRLPILIVEKMGPHFAIGDTCYARAEDHAVYNPDGKEIIARENEISARRHEAGFQAYYNCHTDITIPYDEIAEILVVDRDENMIPIIQDGAFVLEGTEALNRPLNNG
ncbi:MAG: aminopeptidase [Frisingicoccus sp.]|uniref:aminopeptidase n=1 Tax=Frisingicoccus sp. TaxID=1918627 RepID=UPI002E9CEA65|nr:aminopeptidase [Frisingicoccus sp.]